MTHCFSLNTGLSIASVRGPAFKPFVWNPILKHDSSSRLVLKHGFSCSLFHILKNKFHFNFIT